MTATTATPRLGNTEATTDNAEMKIVLLDQVTPVAGRQLSNLSGYFNLGTKDMATVTSLKAEMERVHGSSNDFDSAIFLGIKSISPSYRQEVFSMHNQWSHFKAQAEGVSTNRETHFIECNSDGTVLDESAVPVRFALVNPVIKEGSAYVGPYRSLDNSGDSLIAIADSVGDQITLRGFNQSTLALFDNDHIETLTDRCWVKQDIGEYILPPEYEEYPALELVTDSEKIDLMATKLVVTHSLAHFPIREISTGRQYLIKFPGNGLYVGQLDSDGDMPSAQKITSVSTDGRLVKTENVPEYKRITSEATFYSVPNSWDTMIAGEVRQHRVRERPTIESMEAELVALTQRWDKMNEALNEYAEEQDYCSEFEDSVIPLGFDGRDEQRNIDFNVDLTVRWSTTISLDSGSDMDRIRNIMGGNDISDVEMTINGTSEISVTVTAPRNADSEQIDNEIDHSMINERLNFDYSVDIDDYDVDDWEEL